MFDVNKWYAIHTRAKCESVSAACLSAKGYDVFLPTYRKAIPKHGVSKYAELPLFSGYLFCRVAASATGKLITTPGVLGVVSTGRNHPTPVDEREIAYIEAIVGSHLRSQPWNQLPSGTRVRILNGPLKGLEGIVIQADHSRHLIVSVSLLHRLAAVTLDESTLVIPLLPQANGPDEEDGRLMLGRLGSRITD